MRQRNLDSSKDNIEIEWGPNWEDDLAGGHVTGPKDPNIQKIEEDIKFHINVVNTS
jgi:nitrate reductase beta subunit